MSSLGWLRATWCSWIRRRLPPAGFHQRHAPRPRHLLVYAMMQEGHPRARAAPSVSLRDVLRVDKTRRLCTDCTSNEACVSALQVFVARLSHANFHDEKVKESGYEKSTLRLHIHTGRMSIVMNVVKVKRRLHKTTAKKVHGQSTASPPLSRIRCFLLKNVFHTIHTKHQMSH